MCRPMALSSPHVCRQLQLCLPGVRVFLDVDDLKDISALESSIEQSAVVLIFLSKNYFGSRNWCAAPQSACVAFSLHCTAFKRRGPLLVFPYAMSRLRVTSCGCAPDMLCSWRCSLREARTAAQEDKILVLVHEADPRCALSVPHQ